jgi:hypothetical protein
MNDRLLQMAGGETLNNDQWLRKNDQWSRIHY